MTSPVQVPALKPGPSITPEKFHQSLGNAG